MLCVFFGFHTYTHTHTPHNNMSLMEVFLCTRESVTAGQGDSDDCKNSWERFSDIVDDDLSKVQGAKGARPLFRRLVRMISHEIVREAVSHDDGVSIAARVQGVEDCCSFHLNDRIPKFRREDVDRVLQNVRDAPVFADVCWYYLSFGEIVEDEGDLVVVYPDDGARRNERVDLFNVAIKWDVSWFPSPTAKANRARHAVAGAEKEEAG